MQVVTAIRQYKIPFKSIYPFFLSLIIVPVVNAAYLLSLNLQSDPSMPASIGEQAAFEFWMLGGFIDFVRRGRFPSGNEILRLPRTEVVLSIILAWFLTSLGCMLLWLLLNRVLRSFIRPRFLLALVAVIVLLGLFLPSVIATLPIASNAHVNINVVANSHPLLKQLGCSQGGEIQMQKPGFFNSVAEKLLLLQPSLIRIDHVFDYYNVYQIDKAGDIQYDWFALDQVVDAIFAAGAKPLISLTYLPPPLAKDTVYGPPADWDKWQGLIYETVHHFNIDRHLNIEYWEVWNEPNTTSFWTGTMDDYLHLYEVTARGALRADPSIKIGGPAALSLQPEFALGLPFYEQNWITTLVRYTKEHNLPLSFVSWHYYESRPAKFAWSVSVHRSWLNTLGVNPELLITEWNLSGGANPKLDTEETAAYAAAVLTVLADSPVRAALFFEPFDSSARWEGYWGMMRVDETPKPVYYAFKLAAQLIGQKLTASGDNPQLGILAAKIGDKVSMLLSNTKLSPIFVQITVSGLSQNSSLVITTSGVDGEHGNNYRRRDNGNLLIGTSNEQIQTDKWQTTIVMPASNVRLIELQQH